jgi:hypothetical protein
MQQAQENPSDLKNESDSSSSEPAKRKRGRPKGSKTRLQTVDVLIKPDGCPACQSTNRTVIGDVKSREMSGRILGFGYSKVTWRYVKCDDCSQHYRTRTYYGN